MSGAGIGIILFAYICSISVHTVVGFGETCIDDNSCTQNSEVCNSSDNSCVCDTSNNYFYIESQCVLKADLGASCAGTICLDLNAECGSNNICVCKSSHYDTDGTQNTGGSCVLRKELGSSCSNIPNECADSAAQCLNRKCTCGQDHYDSNGITPGGSCYNRKELGSSCSNIPNECADSAAQCLNRKCTCGQDHYDSNGITAGGSCYNSKILGKTCSGLESECKDSNAQCLDDKCTCGSNYYDSNGFSDGGNCDYISNLQVKEINFPADLVTTSGFTVRWTPPDGILASFVNRYEIIWRLKNSLNGQRKEIASTETSLVISTGVTAGRTYTVFVISENTKTQNNTARRISLSKEQAAKPNIPGAIDKNSSDLNASDSFKRIVLYWGHASGGVSGYKIELSDGTNSKSSNSTPAYVTFNPSWLKNGHRYNVTIQAKSETYEGGNVVLSEVYREEIKTVVTEPTAPESVSCREIYDESIVLEWQTPLMPNGDLVRYTVDVYDSSDIKLFTKNTSGVVYTLTVENLKPGTHYTFKVFTQNEQYISTTSGDTTCQTKAKLSDPPNNLKVTIVTSRDFTVQWDKPDNTYSEENSGYVIQTREGEKCIKEIVYNCSDCKGSFQPSDLENICEFSVRDILPTTKSNLTATLSYQFVSLLPDTTYTISAAAINSKGRGNVAKITQTTNEEVPQTPFSVEVSDITRTSFLVAWSISGPRPGKTIFTVNIEADHPAPNKEITVTGFTTRSKLVDNLEEFWNYVVSVEATTSKGSRKSPPTIKMRTSPAAPGEVSGFKITDAPGGNYTQMKFTWKAPEILKRNSIIKEYKFDYYSDENSRFPQLLQQESTDTYEYTVFVDVRPEQTYTVQVFAVNEQNQKGNEIEETRKAPAGVPINIEYTMHVNIISAYEMIDRRQGMFSVTIVPEFFEESTYGMIRATGLLSCAKNCDFSRIKTLQDFNGLRNWKQASDDGFTLYRVTNPAWLLNLYAQITPCSGRRKRAVRSLIYTVGQDDCTDVASDEYCNGPLSPNTDFVLVAVSCTNGGCLLSKEYGPFSTIPAPISTVQDYNCTTQTVIVGVVLGLIIVILSVYAGYVTVWNRRYRRRKDYSQEHTAKKRNKKEQLYVNELMTARTASVEKLPSNPAMIREPESEYSRLDDATREEKSVYDIIHAL